MFDYNHRQKENELQRQLELQEKKRLQLLQEQEKALLAQLQLDEETGEYVPRLAPSAPLQSAVAPLEVTQVRAKSHNYSRYCRGGPLPTLLIVCGCVSKRIRSSLSVTSALITTPQRLTVHLIFTFKRAVSERRCATNDVNWSF